MSLFRSVPIRRFKSQLLKPRYISTRGSSESEVTKFLMKQVESLNQQMNQQMGKMTDNLNERNQKLDERNKKLDERNDKLENALNTIRILEVREKDMEVSV